MKNNWKTPMTLIEQFVPNEYVAVCLKGSLQCQYPGNGITNGQEEFDDYNGQESGWYRDDHRMLHGLCGNNTKVALNSADGLIYETLSNGAIDMNRPITNLKGYQPAVGTYIGVTWDSTDGSGIYHHRGRLIIEATGGGANHS